LPVPDASVPAVEICSERSLPGMMTAGRRDIVVGNEHHLEQALRRRIGVDYGSDGR
jgi:hypothetical protein